jgi:two-component system nitrogen regulation response regulator NtrX
MPNVLIIDDELASCAPVAALLRRDGIETKCVPNALEALSALRQNEPDLVLLDLSMPRTDGLQLLDALMDEPRFAHLRVAVFSGRNDPETVETARRLGARDFIEKGQDWEQIRQRILAHLGDAPDPA